MLELDSESGRLQCVETGITKPAFQPISQRVFYRDQYLVLFLFIIYIDNIVVPLNNCQIYMQMTPLYIVLLTLQGFQ